MKGICWILGQAFCSHHVIMDKAASETVITLDMSAVVMSVTFIWNVFRSGILKMI